MSDVINLDIVIRQGAEYRAEYQRITARHVFEAAVAGTSDASAPTWPTTVDSTIADNDITWVNKGVYSADLHSDIDVWLPSTAYARRAKIVIPVAAVDLTGYTGAFQIREVLTDAATLHTGVVTFGTPRSDGKFNMIISTVDTTALDFEDAVYDLELINASSEVDFVVRGNVILVKEVTR